jgi:hypothetical protein
MVSMKKTIPLLLAAAALAAASAQPAAAVVIKPAKTFNPDVPTAQSRYAVQHDLDNGWSTGRECATPATRGYLRAFGAWGYFIPGCETRIQWCPRSATNPGTGEEVEVTRCRLESVSSIMTEHALRHRVTLNQRITVYDDQYEFGWNDDQTCAGIRWCNVQSGDPDPVVNPYVTEGDELWVNPGEGATVECNGVRSMGPNTAGVSCGLRMYWSAD